MHYLYILKSLKDNRLYIGQTSDLRRRINEHNNGENKSTSSRTPFKLVYYEAYANKIDACKREANLKLFKKSYSELKKRIESSLMWIVCSVVGGACMATYEVKRLNPYLSARPYRVRSTQSIKSKVSKYIKWMHLYLLLTLRTLKTCDLRATRAGCRSSGGATHRLDKWLPFPTRNGGGYRIRLTDRSIWKTSGHPEVFLFVYHTPKIYYSIF